LTAASAIALCRALWPQVTEAAASDVWLKGWYADAVQTAGASWFDTSEERERAVAHLLAHAAFRLDPFGVFGAGLQPGVVSAATTGRRSVTYGGRGVDQLVSNVNDASLATTKAGQEYLRLRNRQTSRAPFMVQF